MYPHIPHPRSFIGFLTMRRLIVLVFILFAIPFAQNSSLYFDGNEDYVILPIYRESLGVNYTMSAWIKYEGTANANYQAVFGGQSADFFIGKNNGNTWIGVQDNQYIDNHGGDAAWDGDWHNVTVVRNGTTINTYLDGVQVSDKTYYTYFYHIHQYKNIYVGRILMVYLISKSINRFGHQKMLDSMIHDGLWDAYNNMHMGSCAEMLAAERNYTRQQQDDYSIRSYKRAQNAQEEGYFSNLEII